jgi:hypothetical protein
MNINVGIGENQIPEGLPAQMEPSLTDSRLPSVVSSGTDYDNEDYTGELWDELEVVLQVQEGDFIEQDETVPMGVPQPLFDTPATPIVKRPSMPMSPTLSFQHLSVIPSLVSGPSLSPSVSPLKPPLCPLSPMRPIVTNLKGDCQPCISPPHPHVPLPSQGASVVGQSARTMPARELPSWQFFASPDQIDTLGMPRSWIHSQVITTLGNTFCYTSRSKPRHEQYKILPTNLFNLWNSSMEGHIASWASLSFHFKQAVSPFKCRAWLIPVLLEDHWYLLAFDWIDHALCIYDSLAMNRSPKPSLVKFGGELLNLIAEDFELEDYDWTVIPEQVSSFHCSLTRF